MLEEFLLSHSNLEHLQLEHTNNFPVYVPSKLKLPKLRSLVYEDEMLNQGQKCLCTIYFATSYYIVSFLLTEIVEAFVNICPSIEWLHLYQKDSAIFYDGDFLSAITFSNLNSLHINETSFHLDDAGMQPLYSRFVFQFLEPQLMKMLLSLNFKIQIIKNCPKLRSFHINGTHQLSSTIAFYFFHQLIISSKQQIKIKCTQNTEKMAKDPQIT